MPRTILRARVPAPGSAPTLSSVSPDLGDTEAGAPLTLTGTNLTGATGVTIGGTACTSVTVVSATSVTCVAPAKAAGTYDVVLSKGAQTATLTNGYEAWSPLVDYAAGRVLRSGTAVTSAGSATRHRSGKVVDPIVASFIERDGATMFELSTGRLILLGGWSATNQAAWGNTQITNEIIYSDDRGYTWAVLQAHVDNPPTSGAGARFKPGHTAGVLMHEVSGVPYVYWIGSDANAGASRDGGVWRALASDLAAATVPTTAWERISTAAPTSGKSLFMVASFNGAIYVMGGQTDLALPATAVKTVYKSTDHGVTWTQLADAPWAARGGVYNPVVFGGDLYIAGGATYDAVPANRTYYNDVYKLSTADAWTQVLANGHGQWTGRHYHSLLSYKSKLWIINGFDLASGNLTDAYSSPTGATWTAVAATAVPWVATHAQSVLATSTGILITQGIQGAALYKLVEHTGALASQWDDQGSGALSLTQATDAAKPIVDTTALGTQPGLVATRAQRMNLAAIDRNITGGVYEVWAVGKSLNTDTTQDATQNPPCTVVGTFNSSAYNEFGFNGGGLQYRDLSITPRGAVKGSGYSDDRVRLIGFEHQIASGKAFVGTSQVGTTETTFGFDTTWTGWDGIGSGINTGGTALDQADFVYGAVVVLKTNTPSSATFRTKLNKWAKKWGSIT